MKTIRFALVLALSAALAAPLVAEESESYGYLRTLEGSAVLTRADTGERVSLLPNYPLEAGDEVATDPLTRAELVLPDFSILRLDGDTRVVLAELAYSAGTADRQTVLGLEVGDLQLELTEYALGDQLPTIHTANATIYVLEPGAYRIAADTLGRTRLVVRQGYAEVGTARGSAIARSGEEILVEGDDWPAVSVLEAGYPDGLETWAEDLSAEAAAADYVDEVDPALGYSAASLDGYGEWVDIEGESAWRPEVEVSWRPYSRGTWVPRTAGLTWVSYEPWGWVPAHYGYWSFHPSFGWVWYPGYTYSPAWVYWYWGPEWVGWVPVGYYGDPYYSPFYGFAGGYWNYYHRWTFCPTYYIGHPHGPRHHYPGSEMPGRTGRLAVPRGLITNETRGIDRAVWRDGEQVAETLARRARDARGEAPPDVTDFVAGRSDPGRDALRRATVDRVPKDRTAARSGDGDAVVGRDQHVRPRRQASDRIAHQGWRDGDDRVVVIRPRGEAAGDGHRPSLDHGRIDASGSDAGSRLRQAWRSRYESSDRYRIWRGHSDGRTGADHGEAGHRSPEGRDWRGAPLPPARRVIDGIRTRPQSDDGRSGSTSSRDAGRSHRSLPPSTTRRDTGSSRGRDASAHGSRSSRSDSGRRSTSSRGRDSHGSARSHGSSSRSRSSGSARSRGSDGGGSRSHGRSGGKSDHGG